MVYYADYEALEFDNVKAVTKRVYPYYLNPNKSTTSLCPIFFSACDRHGEIIFKQNVLKTKISFVSFLNTIISKNFKSKTKTLYVWFHNLQYDFRIIIHELFFNKFEQGFDSDTITYTGEKDFSKEKFFVIAGKNLSNFTAINIFYRGFKIFLRDTMRILNSAQDKILKDFNYPKKIDVRWEKITVDNLEDYSDLVEERNVYDITSLCKCLEEFKKIFKEKFDGSGTTSASMSMSALKHYIYKSVNKKMDDDNEYFRSIYPKLNGVNKIISDGCYSGGICTLNKTFSGKEIEKIQMVDINSSYPYSMTQPLPYGEGSPIQDFSDDGYAEYVIYISFVMKGIPFQRCHTEGKARGVLGLKPPAVTYTRSQFPEKFEGYLCINSIDLCTLKKYADVKTLEFKKGILYKTNFLLRDFIVPIYNEKKHEKGVKKMAIKLLLNSLYGKFAQDLSGIVFQYQNIDDYIKVTAVDNETLYKPLASAVTSYSRKNWIDTVYILGESFIYGDTDSVYFTNIQENVKKLNEKKLIHYDELGKWSFDPDYGDYIIKGKFLSKKNYILQLDSKIKLTCVGLSHKYHKQVNFDNFKLNSQPFEVYKMVNIYGGKAMRKKPFQIRERAL